MEDIPEARCYRHPARPTRIRCQRCGRPICGECMIPATVGFQCPDCVKTGLKQTRQNRGRLSGFFRNNPRGTSIVLIVINAAIWLVIQVAGPLRSRVVDFLGLIPTGLCETFGGGAYYPGVGQAECATVLSTSWVPGVSTGAWWQIFTSLFTHESIPHILFNCMALLFLGPELERLIGRSRFLATYLAAGVIGSLAVLCFSSAQSISYGASGALFGLMGALLIVLLKERQDVRGLLIWVGVNIALTFIGSNISWQAHLGGLIGGALIALIWAYIPPRRQTYQWLLFAVIAVVVGAGIVARSLALATI